MTFQWQLRVASQRYQPAPPWVHPISSYGLVTSSFPEHPLTWHFFTEGESSLHQTSSLGPWTWDSWRLALPGEKELRSSVSLLASLCPCHQAPPPPHSAADPHFTCDTLAEAISVALPRSGLIRHQLGSDFSSLSPTFAWVAGVYSVEHWSLCLKPISNSMYQPHK